ncbi:MAG: hypothetical protein M1280_03505, partial [Actinobacteria bacterium]|nr:hypothetical protein [Actinomycetota bacterium]
MFDTLEKSSIADRIQGIEKSLKDAVDGLDLKNCTNEELSGLLLSLGDIERICSCTKAMAAHLLAEKNLLSGPSDRSAAHGLASKENIPVSKAKELISVGRCLSGHPMVAKEALDAGLSLAQISCIDGAVELNPKKEAELVQIAKSGSLANLRDACARSKREAIGERAMREKIHSKRYFRCFTDPDGMRHLKAGGNVEDMAYIEAAVELRRKYIFDEAYREGRREPFDAYGFDAFLEVFTEGSGDPILINHPLTELADSSQATGTPAAPPAGTVAPSQATGISTNHPGKSIGTIPTSTPAMPPAGIPTASQATGISTKHYPHDETQQPYSGDETQQPDSGYGSSPLPTTTPATPSAGIIPPTDTATPPADTAPPTGIPTSSPPTATPATPPAGIPPASQATEISTKHYPHDGTQQPYSGDETQQPYSGYGSSPLPTTTPATPSAGIIPPTDTATPPADTAPPTGIPTSSPPTATPATPPVGTLTTLQPP